MAKKNIDFKKIEEKWRKFWEKEEIYKFNPKSKKPIYSIDTPPPTVSGRMHIGHAFSYSQEDFIARFRRMKGFNIFYPFGTDDNGLATIRLIEREKKVKAFDLGREKFIKLVLETLKKELRPEYIADWKNIGMSCDWNIFYTTIDKHCQKITQRSFIDLYKSGREYRKKTPFMWCPECQTSIAQVEMRDKNMKSNFVYIKLDTSLGKSITIATTRPELMPACVAVHVNPSDKRYKKFIGQKAKLPLFNHEVEICANEDVDIEFGSGAVYHCTFGDMDDVEWINKMKIEPIEVMNKDGTFNEKAGKYKGMKSEKAREEIINDLKKLGVIEKIEPIEHVVNVHERCDTPIEILMTEQWFIKYLDLKKQMLVWGNKLEWYPEYMKVRYNNWIKGLKYDWSISRQRYFGVPIPVWYCKKCGEIVLPEESQLPVDPLKDKPKKKCKCGSDEFEGEKDVLDTWATSSLTPDIVRELMPKNLKAKLYPMSLRPQAHDIITFWLFNTVVKGNLHHNKNPFKDVMISGFVLDSKGKKMSKSKGNVIAPQEIVSEYGADALRFAAAGGKLGEDISYQEKDVVTGKKFITKLINASKFVFMNLKDYKPKKPKKLEKLDEGFLIELDRTIYLATSYFEDYEYSRAKFNAENFFWKFFCDFYLEAVKGRVYNGTKREKESAFYTLYTSLLAILKMMAPFTPFITEEIYQNYYKKNEKDKSIHISAWPKQDFVKKIEKWDDKNIKSHANELTLFVTLLTQIRAEKTKAKKPMNAECILTINKINYEDLKEVLEDLKNVTNAKEIKSGKQFKVEF
ncbi:valine--tRNA ligase [Candidatus Pacearchaeota archaeon]|nr:valine--tRNA ligase [Candidatus Pacearchaeota archaeon]